MDFFAIASAKARVRFEALLRDGIEADASSQLLREIETCASADLPGLLRAIELRPHVGTRAPKIIAGALNRTTASPSLCMDIAWTWMHAWVATATTSGEFLEVFRDGSANKALRSSFLLGEFARATVIQARPDAYFFLAPAITELDPAAVLTGVDAIEFGIAVARLVYGATPNSVTSAAALALVDGCIAGGAKAFAAFQKEADICTSVIEKHASSGVLFSALTPRELATAIVLQELQQATQVADAETGWSEPAETRYKRMHKLVGSVVSASDPRVVPQLLLNLAADPDLLLRCAVVHYAFTSSLVRDSLSKHDAHDLKEIIRACVTTALSKGPHHWLRAAAIGAHCDASAARASLPIENRWSAPAIGTLGLEKDLVQCGIEQTPGLSAQIERFKRHHKRVALVLPSIDASITTTSDTERRQANQGSPPLGLGQIATHLGSLGHLVRLYDAHRYRYDTIGLARELAVFDFVGVSIVFSTIRSATSLIAEIRKHGGTSGPTIVVGGHAPTLMESRRIQAAGLFLDYLVVGPGEEAFEQIVADDRRDGIPRLVTDHDAIPLSEMPFSTTRELATARSTASSRYQFFIEGLAWMDRAVFTDPLTGQAYEPSITRNKKDVEAHLVLSRGCDWRCSFCTEALIAGKHGENRRSVADLMGEIAHLARHNGVNRIQFIDDNVFPTLPAYKRHLARHEANAILWADSFLNSLTAQAEGGSFQKWRGLMRAEDFLRYEELIPQFVDRLSASGCNLLAFGFECGSERARATMKGGRELVPTNAELAKLVTRLRVAGIFVKGYFIIGGPGQTKMDVKDTISFALSCGVDLAYFAIYKDFRRMAQIESRNEDMKIFQFRLFSADILDQAANDLVESEWEAKFGPGIPREQRQLHAAALKKLHQAGFSFNHLVRYNDYHEWMTPYSDMGFADHADYFKTLCEAYLRFYARPEWINRYEALLASGY